MLVTSAGDDVVLHSRLPGRAQGLLSRVPHLAIAALEALECLGELLSDLSGQGPVHHAEQFWTAGGGLRERFRLLLDVLLDGTGVRVLSKVLKPPLGGLIGCMGTVGLEQGLDRQDARSG